MKTPRLLESLISGIDRSIQKASVRSFAAFAFCALLAVAHGPVLADSAILTKSGALYEVYPANYSDIVYGAGADGRTPLLALKVTPPGGQPVVEIVPGTFDENEEGAQSIEFDESTQTVFIVYTKFHGLMAEVHVAVLRNAHWAEQNILPTSGLYLSLNPQVLVTRQRYVDFVGTDGQTTTKMRSILSLIWWEEGGSSQARYAAVFVEDGVLRLDNVVAYNLNELAQNSGRTDAAGLPYSSYCFPALQRDPVSNGGALISFANLATRAQSVLRITFPDDITTLVAPGSTSASPDAYARGHIPIGREIGGGRIPSQIDVSGSVGTLISPSGVPTFYWQSGSGVSFLRGDAPEAATPNSITLRPDFSLDRALILLRDMSAKD